MPAEKTSVLEEGGIDKILEEAQKQQACLIIIAGAPLGKKHLLESTVSTMGRDVDVDITIDDTSISRKHAEVTKTKDNEFMVKDLESTNGTFINNEKITEGKLENGDILRVGNTSFKFLKQGNIETVYHKKINDMVSLDFLTKVYNRQYINEYLLSEFAHCIKTGRELSIVYFDLDHFKKINDTYGHPAGDYVLVESCHVVKNKVIRTQDVFGRIGGEEFVVIMPGTNSEEACRAAERIRVAVESNTFKFDSHTIPVSISLGVAYLDAFTKDIDALMKRADNALYQAKNSGRNRVCLG